MFECGNCIHWQNRSDMPTVGQCKITGDYTGVGASCALHEAAGSVSAEKAEKSEKPFNVPNGADKVWAAYQNGEIAKLDIMSAHLILNRKYIHAAIVIKYLEEAGKIGAIK